MKVDKFKSRKEWAAAIWQRLLKDIKNPDLGAILDSLLSPYEKSIIVNRLAAVSLIKEGRTYREIGRELWLSSTTIRSLKRVSESGLGQEYQSYRLLKNRRQNKAVTAKKEIIEIPAFLSRIDYYLNDFPKKGRPRWKL